MARANPGLLEALRQTADRVESQAAFQWSHQGHCICGHLVQTTTGLTPQAIHAYALERSGDWAEHAMAYCESSDYPVDHLVASLLELGLSRQDIGHLERLDDPGVVRVIQPPRGRLNRHCREDVAVYLRTMAELLVADLDASPRLAPSMLH